jgi:Ras-related protein Rab-21
MIFWIHVHACGFYLICLGIFECLFVLGALLVYDVTDRDSFLKVKLWVKELRKMLGKEVTLAIAGNKVDLNRVVSLEEAQAYADSVGAKHFNTSAKLNQGLNELFLDLAQS